MYKEVGKEIKKKAADYTIVQTCLYGAIGCMLSLVVCQLTGMSNLWALVATAVCAAVGYLKAREKAIYLYAFGEMVDCITEIKKKLCEEESSSDSTPE